MDLYTYFSQAMHCYESDLCYPDACIWEAAAIEAIPDDRFSLEQWNTFLTYVFRQPIQLNSAAEAKKYLLVHRVHNQK